MLNEQFFFGSLVLIIRDFINLFQKKIKAYKMYWKLNQFQLIFRLLDKYQVLVLEIRQFRKGFKFYHY